MTYTIQIAGNGLAHIAQLLQDSNTNDAEFTIEYAAPGYFISTDDNRLFDTVFIECNRSNYTIQVLEAA